MRLLTFCDKIHWDLNLPVVIQGENAEKPLFVGRLGDVPFSLLARDVQRIFFETGYLMHNDAEFSYDVAIKLK